MFKNYKIMNALVRLILVQKMTLLYFLLVSYIQILIQWLYLASLRWSGVLLAVQDCGVDLWCRCCFVIELRNFFIFLPYSLYTTSV